MRVIRCSARSLGCECQVTCRGRRGAALGFARRSGEPAQWSGAADGVIHAAFIHDFSNYAPARRPIDAPSRHSGVALAGSTVL